jgi:hypothetical protein
LLCPNGPKTVSSSFRFGKAVNRFLELTVLQYILCKQVKAAENRILYTTNKIASIAIKNKKKEETDVHLEVTIYGTVCTKDLEKDVMKVIEKPNTNDLNPENVIKCDIKVAANETKEFGFTYGMKKWEVQTLANVNTMSNDPRFGVPGVQSKGAFGFK